MFYGNKTNISSVRIAISLNTNKNVFNSISFYLKKIKITYLIQNYHVTFVNVTSYTKAVP
jgi:hypothetical protein